METLTQQLERAIDAVAAAQAEMDRIASASPASLRSVQESVERKLRYREDMLVAAAHLWREERRMLAAAERTLAAASEVPA
jgi:hypothetical protein